MIITTKTVHLPSFKTLPSLLLSPVQTNPGTFETFFYTNRSFLCSHETSESPHSSAAFSCKKMPFGVDRGLSIQFLVLVFVLVLESRGL